MRRESETFIEVIVAACALRTIGLVHMPASLTVIVGDIGGTNARLQVLRYSRLQITAIPSIVQLTRQTYRTNTFSGLATLLQRLFDDIQNELQSTCVQDAIEEKR